MKKLLFITSFLFCFLLTANLTGQPNNEILNVEVQSDKHSLSVTLTGNLLQNHTINDSFGLNVPLISGNPGSPQFLASTDAPPVESEPETPKTFFENIWALMSANWIATILAIMTFLKVFVNLTPTQRDNEVFAWLDNIVNTLIPNRKVGGGTHPKT